MLGPCGPYSTARLLPCRRRCLAQELLAARGVSASLAAVDAYVKWLSLNYVQEAAKGKRLPNIAYGDNFFIAMDPEAA